MSENGIPAPEGAEQFKARPTDAFQPIVENPTIISEDISHSENPKGEIVFERKNPPVVEIDPRAARAEERKWEKGGIGESY